MFCFVLFNAIEQLVNIILYYCSCEEQVPEPYPTLESLLEAMGEPL